MLKPVDVITCLEDSPASIDRLLLAAYLGTVYRVVGPPGFSFHPGMALPAEAEYWLTEHGIRCWAFITAWNPRSEAFSEQGNRERNGELADLIAQGGWEYYPGVGAGTDGSWPPEESFWMLNVPPEDTIRLGRRFGQNALLWWEKGKVVELWWLV